MNFWESTTILMTFFMVLMMGIVFSQQIDKIEDGVNEIRTEGFEPRPTPGEDTVDIVNFDQ